MSRAIAPWRAPLVAALAAGCTLAACKGKGTATDGTAGGTAAAEESPRADGKVSLPVAGRPVRKGDLVLSVVATGQVRSDAVARLKSEAAGTVLEVLVTQGQPVRRGEPLVRLDPRPLDLAVQEAEAAVAQARVQYLDAIVPESLLTGKPPTEERRQNAIARSGLAAAQARLERARLDRERGTITAPFDGVVDQVSVAAGERLAPNQDVATVVDLQHLRVEAQVLEHDLALVRVGGQAMVTTAAAPDRPVPGRIVAVLPLVDSAARAGRAVVRVSGAGGLLRPGMYADVRLEADRLPGRTLVPASAIIERDGRPLVFVARGGRAQWTYVTPGRSNGAETEILPDSATGQLPVQPGDTVLVEGHLTLTHDAPVRVLSADARK